MYPKILNTKDMILYVNKLSKRGVLGCSVIKDDLPHKIYYLEEIKVPKRVWGKKKEKKEEGILYFQPDDIVRRYASLPTEFPPLVFGEDGVLIDGGHRLAAASYRGDSHIKAYMLLNTEEQELRIRILRVKKEGEDKVVPEVFLSMKEAIEFTEKTIGSKIILENGGTLIF
jgi:hypothetical protein